MCIVYFVTLFIADEVTLFEAKKIELEAQGKKILYDFYVVRISLTYYMPSIIL